MTKDTSGPAFPMMRDQSHEERFIIEPGMTLRQWYAGLAMQSILQTCNEFPDETWRTGLAIDAFKMADAMIAEGNK